MKISGEEYDRDGEKEKRERTNHTRLLLFCLREKRTIRSPIIYSLLYLFCFPLLLLFPHPLSFTSPRPTSPHFTYHNLMPPVFSSTHTTSPSYISHHLTSTSHLATSRHHTTPHHTTFQSTRHLTSLLLCSAFFANSTILCVSGFEDPSSARLE
jgi:hypothetical protein